VPANPVVCRSAMPKRTFIERRAWMAASLRVRWRPRLPVGAASQRIPGSNQIVEPRRLRASWWAGPFLALQVRRVGQRMQTSYHAGFTR
jgi:hypothetical protein